MPRHIFVVDFVFIDVYSKISDENLNEFNRKFGTDLVLEGASYGRGGSLAEVKYRCNHPALENFRGYVRNWLSNHEFPYRFFTVTSGISLHCSKKLSDEQICSFMNEFEFEYMKYEISCNSDQIRYEFS